MDKVNKENTFLCNRIQQLDIEKNELLNKQQRNSFLDSGRGENFDEFAELE